jgi:predicted metal-dependent phosphoesterase TrpH
MRYHFDFHTHSFFSSDAASKPEKMIEVAKSKGLSGIAITDHNTCRVVDYCLQKGLMRKDGLPVDDFLILPGVEVSTAEGHLLCIGITLPDRKGIPATEVAEEIRTGGGIPIPAHPFDRWRAGIPPEVMEKMHLEVVEAFNAAVTWKSYNQQARAYAEKHSLRMIAGSDAHHPTAIGVCWTTLELESLSLANVLRQLPQATQIEEHYLSFLEGLKKNMSNWFRVFNPKFKG